MPGPQVETLVRQIQQKLPRTKDLQAALDEVKSDLESFNIGLSNLLAGELSEATAIVAKQFEAIEILHTHSLIRKRERWYFGSRPTDLHWPAVKDYLTNAKGWHPDDIKAIDEAASEVVSLLGNPGQNQFSSRGLVVGYVQSGKTANMTGVISKALDAGYNTIIVLAGLTNKLRFQTQLRLYKDLVERNPLHWQVLTPNEENKDFRAPPQGGFLSHTDKAQLAVIKKNVSPLGQLRDAVERTLPAALERLRILVIDDECDQGSVNSARGELNMTAINQRIRELLQMLPAATYVGYTATPFANVLIDPYRKQDQELDDLYPRDFITALPRPQRYFGTEQLFGRTPVDPGNVTPEEDGLDMIRPVPEADERLLQPATRQARNTFQPAMTESLERSLLYFIACCAVRRARGDADQHMSMLIHTSAYVSAHERLASLIRGWLDVNDEAIRDPSSNLGEKLADVWVDEQHRLPGDITTAQQIDLAEIRRLLPAVLDALEVAVENGASDDRIDYTKGPKTYVIVGGSILARGLTLEGLMMSYFLRTANQYDTLLQMGRWFGYRPQYEDLPRIAMPEDLQSKFRSMATVEQEIRDDIAEYGVRDLSPMDIAVRIRAIPGMAITAANKMKAARQCAISFWGTHRQTFRFDHQNSVLLDANWEAGAELVSRADALGLRQTGSTKLWRGVPKSSIVRFFEEYQAHPSHADLDRRIILDFIAKSDPRLSKWNVGIVEAGKGDKSPLPLGKAGTLNMVSRARLKDSPVADIKALMSKQDVVFDCEMAGATDLGWEDLKTARSTALGAQVPLLLLYPIDRASAPQTAGGARVALDAATDVLGYGVVFPGSVTDGGDYVSVELRPLSADEIENIEAEELAQAEAAGVV
ncbi:Z1 domain-containing protein [Aminobacter sp. HY435]|uniref:Z1 domain-containing protein n=1 Tax=Aminobacter sp. HY435 TaxID=2970917 RepID=UPI0022B9B717|nr:Z1 domain-containing protein [Aminobacter sp. HY435]